MRPTDVLPQILIDELLRLYRKNPEWLVWENLPDEEYKARCVETTWIKSLWVSGADAFAMFAGSIWLGTGPKVFIPRPEQCQALEQVAVNLFLEDYSQPYPALLVVLPSDLYPPFRSVLCHRSDKILTCMLHSDEHLHDITTTVGRSGVFIEDSLQKFDEDCQATAVNAAKALRVACNSCLALSHYGNHLDYLFPKELERDRRLGREKTERGERARQRIPLAVQVASLDREVKLHKTETRLPGAEPGHTGRELPCHWRRGGWAIQPHGPGGSLRKRILRRPTLVRADLFIGDPTDLQTTYRG